ncbi:MAG: hypothetical protein ABIA78_02225, partial [archaeon]
FDASTLISFSMNGLFEELRKLKEIFDGKFLITSDVKREIIDKPMTIDRFKFEALRLNQLLEDKILEMPVAVGVEDNEISGETQSYKEIANSIFESKDGSIHVLDSGETSCLALSRILDNKKIKNIIAVDERTLRMLVEKPDNLRDLLERRSHTKITLKKNNFKSFKGFRLIRSTELIYVAYKKGLIKVGNGKLLDALLWALKSKGCAITNEEIVEMKRLG